MPSGGHPLPTIYTAARAADAVLVSAQEGHLELTHEEKAALEKVRDGHQSAITKLARLCGSERMSRAQIEQAFNQTRLMGRGVSRVILEMLLEKAAGGDACPYDAKVLQFLAKGFGIVAPGKPVSDEDRRRQIASLSKIRAMTDAELADDVMEMVRSTREASGAD